MSAIIPNPPPLARNGAYDRTALIAWLDAAETLSVKPAEMAFILGVDLHRITYMLGEGRKVMARKASVT